MKELEKLVKLRDQPSSSNEDQFEWMLKEHRGQISSTETSTYH
jgi:hypothetical protein